MVVIVVVIIIVIIVVIVIVMVVRVGDTLYSISSDHSLQGIDCEGNSVVVVVKAHSAPINKFTMISDNVIGIIIIIITI